MSNPKKFVTVDLIGNDEEYGAFDHKMLKEAGVSNVDVINTLQRILGPLSGGLRPGTGFALVVQNGEPIDGEETVSASIIGIKVEDDAEAST